MRISTILLMNIMEHNGCWKICSASASKFGSEPVFLFSREQWGYQGTGHAASSKNCKCLRLANEGSSDRTKVGTGLGVLLKAFSKKLGNIKGTRNFTT